MIDYLYDETFDGLLTCIYHHYYQEKASGIYSKNTYQPSLLTSSQEVISEEILAKKVSEAILKKETYATLYCIYCVFLSCHPEKENLILAYLKRAFKEGASINSHHGDPLVHEMQKWQRKVSHEAHRFTGLLRFSSLDGVLYGALEPDHDILPILANHFIDRYKHEKLIIHDKKRQKALIAQNGQWYMSDVTDQWKNIQSQDHVYQSLWMLYFDSIAIEERTNLRLQMQFVPKKYRKNILEFDLRKSYNKE